MTANLQLEGIKQEVQIEGNNQLLGRGFWLNMSIMKNYKFMEILKGSLSVRDSKKLLLQFEVLICINIQKNHFWKIAR